MLCHLTLTIAATTTKPMPINPHVSFFMFFFLSPTLFFPMDSVDGQTAMKVTGAGQLPGVPLESPLQDCPTDPARKLRFTLITHHRIRMKGTSSSRLAHLMNVPNSRL